MINIHVKYILEFIVLGLYEEIIKLSFNYHQIHTLSVNLQKVQNSFDTIVILSLSSGR